MSPMSPVRPQKIPSIRVLPSNNTTVCRMHSYRFGSTQIIISAVVIAGIIIAILLLS